MIQVLYIDDEADSEKFQSRRDLLERKGIQTTLVSSAAEAVEIIRAGLSKFDVVVLDIIMPPEGTFDLEETAGGTSTGLRILTLLREKDPAIPVLIVSIRRSEEIQPLLKQLSVYRFLSKSAATTTDEIANAILGAFEERRE